MRLFRRMLAGPLRYRCSGGFGVHSPFAYSFITDVLRERRYGYYAYETVKGGRMRLWFRLACRFQPSTVAAHGADRRELLHVASLASPGCRAADAGAQLRYEESAEDVTVCRGETLMLGHVSADDLRRLFDTIDYGMCFANNSGMAVIVAHPGLPHQHFDLFF